MNRGVAFQDLLRTVVSRGARFNQYSRISRNNNLCQLFFFLRAVLTAQLKYYCTDRPLAHLEAQQTVQLFYAYALISRYDFSLSYAVEAPPFEVGPIAPHLLPPHFLWRSFYVYKSTSTNVEVN